MSATSTIEMLVEQDDRAQEKAQQRNLWIAVVVGFVAGVLVLTVIPQVILAIPLPIPFANPIKAILLMIAIAFGMTKLLGVVWPGRRRFPQLKSADGPASAVARMRSSSGKAWMPIAAILVLGTIIGIGQHFAGEAETERAVEERAARATLAAMPAEPEGPTPLFSASNFGVLASGTLSLRGRVELEDSNAVALLYRNPAGDLVLCTVEPDEPTPVTCEKPNVSLIPQTTRLVTGQSKPLIYGVASMGETPEETEYGAFFADGTPFEGEVDSLPLASDRPSAPAPNATWFSGSIDGVSATLKRLDAGHLELTLGDAEPIVVIHDTDHGGPSTGVPRVFKGDTATVVLFQMEAGLSGLRITNDGAEPL